MPALIDLTGRIFGRLKVLGRGENKGDKPGWICICDCGQVDTVRGSDLRMGKHKSCGCLQIDAVTKHGQSRRKLAKTPEYESWINMIQRCYNPGYINYHRYGGRGITVCREWRNSFEEFFKDMGKRPSQKHSLERRNNDSGYSPQNCYWATKKEQSDNKCNNRLITYKGQTKTVTRWAEAIGINPSTLFSRIDNGWSVDRAIETSIDVSKNHR